jgi:hypothetical protein
MKASYPIRAALQARDCAGENLPPGLNTAIGTRDLSAWQPVPGITWVQTRSPQFAAKLRIRSDSRLVLWGVSGGYLRTFEFKHPLAWARRLIGRYQTSQTLANARLNAPNRPTGAFSSESVKAVGT